ncbi:MAG: YdcF family protein [Oscillospiraceae bacterium]|nr:YdcF family protein [Oscillospiraceae bacterium]
MKLKINRKTVLIIFAVLGGLAVLGGALVFGINGYVVHFGEKYILSPTDAAALSDMDCILVLGCGVRDDGTPSHMLEDRLRRGVELYKAGAAPKILMSGDHGRTNYDEVNTMKGYAIDAGVPSEDVFMDHAGFSTYESMYRAQDIFCAEKILIVSQEYHLHRAIYLARALGLEAYGVAADYRTYSGQLYRDIREILARDKDFFIAIFKPDYPYGGETIPVFGNGDLTNDK